MDKDAHIIDELFNGKYFKVKDVGARIEYVFENKIKIQSHERSHFLYEVRPIYTLAKYLKAKEIRFTGLHDHFDGELKFSDKKTIRVECTRCVDSEQEAISGDIDFISGHTKTKPWYKELAQRFTDGFDNKCNKQYDSYYLVMTFRDHEIIARDEKRHYINPIKQFWIHSRHKKHPFSRVFILGDSQNLLWDSENEDDIIY